MSSIDSRKQELKKFGLFVGVVLFCFGLFPVLKGKEARIFFVAPGIALCLTGLVYPSVLAPLYAAWMKLGHVLGKINSFVLLSVIFYVVFMPMRVLVQLFSKERKFGFRTGSQSYWIERQPEDFRVTMKRQF